MGTTVATGTFFVYGLSALFVAFGAYEIMFFFAGILLPLIAVAWIFSYPRLVKQKTEEETHEMQLQVELSHKKKLGWLWIPISILAVYVIYLSA